MKPARTTRQVDLKELWMCEGCQHVHQGKDPPDECWCGTRFFDNLFDVSAETPEDAC